MAQRQLQAFQYFFIQCGTTKSWSDSKAAIDGIADIRRVNERSDAATCMVAGDEETFRFMYHLIRSNPGQRHWLRIYLGDWHLLHHMVKAIVKRYWEAGIEHVAEARGLDGWAASEAINYRVAHYTISVHPLRAVEGARRMKRRRFRGPLWMRVMVGSRVGAAAGGWGREIGCGAATAGRHCCDGGPGRPTERAWKLSAGIWIRDPDSGCSGSEEEEKEDS